jgi:hypothetical protein
MKQNRCERNKKRKDRKKIAWREESKTEIMRQKKGRKGNQNKGRKAQDSQLHDDLVLLATASGCQENERWSPSRQTATFNLLSKQNRPL